MIPVREVVIIYPDYWILHDLNSLMNEAYFTATRTPCGHHFSMISSAQWLGPEAKDQFSFRITVGKYQCDLLRLHGAYKPSYVWADQNIT